MRFSKHISGSRVTLVILVAILALFVTIATAATVPVLQIKDTPEGPVKFSEFQTSISTENVDDVILDPPFGFLVEYEWRSISSAVVYNAGTLKYVIGSDGTLDRASMELQLIPPSINGDFFVGTFTLFVLRTEGTENIPTFSGDVELDVQFIHDPCETVPCKNGGICGTDSICACTSNWIGSTCSTPNPSNTWLQRTIELSHPTDEIPITLPLTAGPNYQIINFNTDFTIKFSPRDEYSITQGLINLQYESLTGSTIVEEVFKDLSFITDADGEFVLELPKPKTIFGPVQFRAAITSPALMPGAQTSFTSIALFHSFECSIVELGTETGETTCTERQSCQKTGCGCPPDTYTTNCLALGAPKVVFQYDADLGDETNPLTDITADIDLPLSTTITAFMDKDTYSVGGSVTATVYTLPENSGAIWTPVGQPSTFTFDIDGGSNTLTYLTDLSVGTYRIEYEFTIPGISPNPIITSPSIRTFSTDCALDPSYCTRAGGSCKISTDQLGQPGVCECPQYHQPYQPGSQCTLFQKPNVAFAYAFGDEDVTLTGGPTDEPVYFNSVDTEVYIVVEPVKGQPPNGIAIATIKMVPIGQNDATKTFELDLSDFSEMGRFTFPLSESLTTIGEVYTLQIDWSDVSDFDPENTALLDQSRPFMRIASCKDISDPYDFTTITDSDQCGLNGSCDIDTGCKCNDGYTGPLCDVAIEAPEITFAVHELDENQVIKSRPISPNEILQFNTQFALTLTPYAGTLKGTATISLQIYDPTVPQFKINSSEKDNDRRMMVTAESEQEELSVEKSISIGWDSADPISIKFVIPTGGIYKIVVTFEIENSSSNHPTTSPHFNIIPKCMSVDGDDLCQNEGTCNNDGTCSCEVGWAGDLCEESASVPVEIYVAIGTEQITIPFIQKDKDEVLSPTSTDKDIIIHTNTQISIDFDPVVGVTPHSTVLITVSYNPVLDETVSTVPVQLIQQTTQTTDQPLIITLLSPYVKSSNVSINLLITPEGMEAYNLKTIPFTILPTCYAVPAESTELQTLASWTSQCQNDGICGVSGTCACAKGYWGANCQNVEEDTPYDYCNMCLTENVKSCNKDTEFTDYSSPCTCAKGFAGIRCDQSNKCLSNSLQACGYSQWRGQFDTLEDGSCAKTCTCANNWGGENCEICQLSCKNNGKQFRRCDKCGCQPGFGGDRCQCLKANLLIDINGNNDIIIATNGIFSGIDGVFDQTKSQDVALERFGTYLNTYFANLLEIPQENVLSTIATPITNAGTRFNTTILYSCEDTTPIITIEDLETLWTGASTKIPTDLGEFFVFGEDTPAAANVDVEPSDSSLPIGSEELNNSNKLTVAVSMFLVIIVAFIV